MATLPDWISAIAAVVGLPGVAISIIIAARAFRKQASSSDIQTAYDIFKEINRYWDLIALEEKKFNYCCGQILSQFEIAASLINNGRMSSDADMVLKDHIIEVFTQLQMDENGKKVIESCLSSKETFCELKKFAKRYQPQALAFMGFNQNRI
ncbi:MAG: hypothetical protein EOP06_28340 [Proteobacteria bacterium]|nr:MAG: hypothetical protein EOP06_28340 [Pseudomonadota bacterium]